MDRVLPQDAVMGEEIFGPVLPVLTVGDLEEAVAFVRERPHPLALYLFSSDTHQTTCEQSYTDERLSWLLGL